MIARRVLTLQGAAGKIDVPVSISAPKQDDLGHWSCEYEIRWPDRIRISAAGGYDSMQALVCALQMIAADIYNSDEHLSGRLMWGSPEEGYGFPVIGSMRNMLRGNDAKFL
jgi:hypothetical protein